MVGDGYSSLLKPLPCIWQELEICNIVPVAAIISISKVNHWQFNFLEDSCILLPLLELTLLLFSFSWLSWDNTFRYICLALLLGCYGFRALALRNPASYTNRGHFITCFHQPGPLYMRKTKTRHRTFPRLLFLDGL